MSNTGRHVRFGSYSGTVVEEFTKRKALMFRVKLDAGQVNPVLGEFGIVRADQVEEPVQFAAPVDLGTAFARTRGVVDPTLLRR